MSKQAIGDCMRQSVERYLHDLQGEQPHGVYGLFIQAAEKPLLEAVMRHAQGNQSLAAEWLGINRNTLRSKLLSHQLLK